MLRPRWLSQFFGLPVEERRGLGFVRAAGVRDIALGVILVAVYAVRDVPVLTVVAAAALFVSLADFAVARTTAGGPLQRAQLVHLAGALLFIAILALLVFHMRR